jgi:FkbH-like protein
MKTFNEIKRNIKKDYTSFVKEDIAILSNSATQLLNIGIRGLAFDYNIDLNIYEADYNQVEYEVFNEGSELYRKEPKYILLYLSTNKLMEKFYSFPAQERREFAFKYLTYIEDLVSTINTKLKNSIILCCNFPEIDDTIFGNQASKTEDSFLYQCRKLNYLLSEKSVQLNHLLLVDLVGLQNRFGVGHLFNNNIYITTDIVLSTDILPYVSEIVLNIIKVRNGIVNKCVILDLDNTLWGGVIGDDGYENIEIGTLGIGKAFTEFQKWLKELKNRGIILAVCSKNNEDVAKEAFLRNTEMVLKLDDISVFVANWNNKADNIRSIQSTLNIGYNSMVFLDDNPVERQIVKDNIPDITVPELPEDPAYYLQYLYSLNLFDTTGVTVEDIKRTESYQKELHISTLKKSFVNESDFLSSLEMVSLVEPFNKSNLARVVQLSQRSNQFNLRTIRYTDNDVLELAASSDYMNYCFTLNDKFGENGLICVVSLKLVTESVCFIENWFMSCRVLKRTMENFVLNTIVEDLNKTGCLKLIGEYIPTAKNNLVLDHYKNLGFMEEAGKWTLSLNDYKNRETYINKL